MTPFPKRYTLIHGVTAVNEPGRVQHVLIGLWCERIVCTSNDTLFSVFVYLSLKKHPFQVSSIGQQYHTIVYIMVLVRSPICSGFYISLLRLSSK